MEKTFPQPRFFFYFSSFMAQNALRAASSLDASTVSPIPWKTSGGDVNTASEDENSLSLVFFY